MQGWDGYYEQGVDDFGFHDRAAIRAVFVSRVALEYIDAPVYIMGTSLGSLYSSMLLGTQSAIKGGVLIVGGAPLSEILETTDEKQLKQLREERMQHYKIKSVAEYEKILTENVRISPENFIDLTKTKTLEMVLAERDTTVPTATQRKLWSAWGKPHLKAFQHDHVPTVVWSFIKDRQKIKSFLLHGIRSNNEK